ncbi:CGNR zinc finger domain-containing protein [Mesorhizobium sp. WSM3626]|uniref:CGNR zinc finger domain-containing protein n=1 Tax=Mesorhizobium sp. WSM3626 TaxID=1040987 RepID=UPI00068854A7|nr:CGNR zinc finger domain-containing protein [Mesorhizobium sp. WSM3626]
MESTEFVRTYVSPLGPMRMLGGAPALDLANTLHWRDGDEIDFIPSYQDLLVFCIPALLLSENEGRVLKRLALNHQRVACDVHLEVLKLRAALKSWLNVTAQNLGRGLAPKRNALRDIHKAIAQAGGSAGLSQILNLPSASTNQAIYLPLRRSAAAAAMLVLFPSGNDIRQCEADKCGGFFINDSRSKPRRWCSMDSCGNRAKAARYRLAHRK